MRPPEHLATALEAWVERSEPDEPLPGGRLLDEDMSSLPVGAAAAVSFFLEVIADGDWAVPWVHAFRTVEQRFFRRRVQDWFVLWVTTDGADGYLEVYDVRGKLIGSARTGIGDFVWVSPEALREEFANFGE